MRLALKIASGRNQGPVHPAEHKILGTRKHPVTLLPSTVTTLAGLAVGGILSLDVKSNQIAMLMVWIVWLPILAYLLYKICVWLESDLVVTDKRLIVTTGILVRRSASVNISKVTSWGFRDSLGGLLLRERGYKSLVLQLEGYDKGGRTIGWIPLAAAREIGANLPSDAWNAVDEEAFRRWSPGGLRRRLRLMIAVLLVCSMAVLALTVANHPRLRAELNDQSDVIALLSGVVPVIITLITP
jgi:membrane protein YdbS with pleckstrin-like domain